MTRREADIMHHHTRTAIMTAILIAAAALPVVAAHHDNDPLDDNVEALVCGYAQLAALINALPSSAGRCVDTRDYVSPVFQPAPCPECSNATQVNMLNVALTPARDVDAVNLPPTTIPSQGPYGTPPVSQPVGTLQGWRESAGRYCISVTPQGREALYQCMALESAGALVPPVGPVPLVSLAGQSVGPTPGVSEGAHGATPAQRAPATSMDFTVTLRWIDARIYQRLGPGLVNYWEPVNLASASEVQWWNANGDKTTLTLRIVLVGDGAPVQTVQVHVPYAGQAAAAAMKNAPTSAP